MTIFEVILAVAWLGWVAGYAWLVWNHGGRESRNYFLLVLPVLLPFESFWRPESQVARIRVLTSGLALLFIQLALANLGVVGA